MAKQREKDPAGYLHEGDATDAAGPGSLLSLTSASLLAHCLEWSHLVQARGGQSDRHKGTLSQGGKR